MKTCKTCKHWLPEYKNHPVDDDRHIEGEGGHCYCPKLTEDCGLTSYAMDALVYPYNEGAKSFWTGPDFGCVQHEELQS